MSSDEAAENWVKREWNPEVRYWVLCTTPKREQKGYQPGRGKPRLVRNETRPKMLSQLDRFAQKLATDLQSGSCSASIAQSRIAEAGYTNCLWVVEKRDSLVEVMTTVFRENYNCWSDSINDGGIGFYVFWQE